jgi:hypothetical protein
VLGVRAGDVGLEGGVGVEEGHGGIEPKNRRTEGATS